MRVILTSAGKGQVLSGQVAADLYIDCRGMINPFRIPSLAGKTGDDPEVQEWITIHNEPYVHACVDMVNVAIESRPSRNSSRSNPDLIVCFFCLAGVHRSRGMKWVVGKNLAVMAPVTEVIIR